MGYVIRHGATGDARAIAEVHVESFRETYAGILPPAVIDAATVDERVALWDQVLKDPASADGLFVVADEAGRLAGFAVGAPARGGGGAAEIFAINLLKRVQNEGAGRALLGRIARHLAAKGCTTLAAWVASANLDACGLYAGLGAVPNGHRVIQLGSSPVEEVRFFWADLNKLAGSETAAVD